MKITLPTQTDLKRLVESSWLTRRNLLLAGGLLIGLLVVVGGTAFWLSSRERAASAAYGEAIARAQMAQGPRAPAQAAAAAIVDLETILVQYPRAGLAGLAAYELGNLRYIARDHDRARAAYETALAVGVPAPVRPLARASIGATWEARQDYARAADTYQATLGDLKPGDYLHESVLFDLARVQELGGRKDQAIETYRRVLKEAPSGPRAGDARFRLAVLGVGR